MDWKGSREKGKRKMGETINRKSDGRGNGRTRREERRGGGAPCIIFVTLKCYSLFPKVFVLKCILIWDVMQQKRIIFQNCVMFMMCYATVMFLSLSLCLVCIGFML